MKVKHGSLTYILLSVLENAVDCAIKLDDFIYHPYKYSKGNNYPPSFNKPALVKTIRRLREAGYIDREKNQEGVILKLTKLGQDYLKPFEDEKWDHKYRVVIWDIPERKRRIRDLFRRRLREWGFKNWQKSVWVSKQNITIQLRSLITELELEKYVSVIESDDKTLEKIFTLNLDIKR
ncbi:MAG TPA: hypothetical protein VG965_03565 [Patescibacteria group bacterium]|nr:hypothetical protein [Patescibacteria group bacterium]